jgi:Leucine-rich repeat (LRR) protein
VSLERFRQPRIQRYVHTTRSMLVLLALLFATTRASLTWSEWGSRVEEALVAQNTSSFNSLLAHASSGWLQAVPVERSMCAISTSHQLYCWGPAAAAMPSDPVGWTSLTGIDDRFCAISASSTRHMACWSPAGAISSISSPHGWQAVVITTDSVMAIERFPSGRLGFRQDDNPTVWTAPPQGNGFTELYSKGSEIACVRELGSASFLCYDVPSGDPPTTLTVPGATSPTVKVSGTVGHDCAITQAGKLHCWGINSDGQLSVPPGVASWVDVATAGSSTCAIDNLGQIHCFGNPLHSVIIPKWPVFPAGWASLSTIGASICAISKSFPAEAVCWGSNLLPLPLNADKHIWLPSPSGSQVAIEVANNSVFPDSPDECLSQRRCQSLPTAMAVNHPVVVLNITAPELLNQSFNHSSWQVPFLTFGVRAIVGAHSHQLSLAAGQELWPAVFAPQASMALVVAGNVSFISQDVLLFQDQHVKLSVQQWMLIGGSTASQAWPSLAPAPSGCPTVVGNALLFITGQMPLASTNALHPGCASNVTVSNRLLGVIPTSLVSVVVQCNDRALGSADLARLSGLTKLYLSQVSEINGGAFAGFTSLQHLSVFDSHRLVVRNTSFNGLTALRSLDLGRSMLSTSFLESDIFPGRVDSLQSLVLPSNLEGLAPRALALTSLTRLVVPATLTSLRNESLARISNLAALDLSHTRIESFPPYAFAGTGALASLKLPRVLRELQPFAMSGLAALTSIDFPPTVDSINPWSLGGLTSLQTLNLTHLPIPVIASRALNGLSALTQLWLPRVLTEIEGHAFGGLNSLTQLSIPSSLAVVHPYSFNGLSAVVALNLSETAITALPNSATQGLTSLTSLTLPRSLASISPSSLSGLMSLTSLSLERTQIEHIPAEAFNGMSSLAVLRIGSPRLRSIAADCTAFEGLTQLKQLISIHGPTEGFGAVRGLPISGFRTCAFRNTIEAIHLESADLGNTALSRTHFNFVATTLNRLVMRRTRITVADDLLSDMDLLEHLDLSSNNISYLPQLSTANLQFLTSIDLHNNTLSTVSANAFSGMFNLQSVTVDTELNCATGTYQKAVQIQTGSVGMCVTCPIGSFCPDGVSAHQCPRGQYSSIIAAKACAKCPAGYSTSSPGSTAFSDCLITPLSCAPGSFIQVSSTGESECQFCPGGTISPGGSSTSCSKCPAGTVSHRAFNSTLCVSCPAGTYNSEDGQALVTHSCHPCGPGLQSDGGAQQCRACPAGYFLNATGGCSLGCEAGRLCLAGHGFSSPPLQEFQGLLLAQPLPSTIPKTRSLLAVGGARELTLTGQQSSFVPDNSQAAYDWTVALYSGFGSLILVTLLLLIIPLSRVVVQRGLKLIDAMAASHIQDEFSAIRRIRTPNGGFFTCVAFSASFLLSVSLIVDFAFNNVIRSDSLLIDAVGLPGADRAARSTSNVVVDVVFQPALLSHCNASSQFAVLSTLSANPFGSMTSSFSVLQEQFCWMRATCGQCAFPGKVQMDLSTHWTAQLFAWRVASMDARGSWTSLSGEVGPPGLVEEGTISAGSTTMLRRREEVVSLVAHTLTDSRNPVQVQLSDGFIPQNLNRPSIETADSSQLRPLQAKTTLSLVVERSTVFADTTVTNKYTFIQLISSIFGLSVGVLGAATVVFAQLEKRCGHALNPLCGDTGIVGSEEQALAIRTRLSLGSESALRHRNPLQKSMGYGPELVAGATLSPPS